MVKAWADGGSFPNSPTGQKVIAVQFDDGHFKVELAGKGTNNEAEYQACLLALEVSKERGFKKIELCLDSMLVINQLSGRWNANPKFRKYIDKFGELARHFDQIDFIFVRSDSNLAHKLVEGELKKIDGYTVWSWKK